MRLFLCPWCHGDGGDYDAVLWHGVGGGPWEDCGLCRTTGRVGPWRLWLDRFWWPLRQNLSMRRYRRRLARR